MYTASILLSSIEAVKKFVTLTNSYSFPVNLTTDRGTIDAKSIMGIFSMDLSKPLRIEVDSDAAQETDQEEFIRQLQQFKYVSSVSNS